jgi:predicted outer membrane repeat protein
MDFELLEKAILQRANNGKKPKAILVVHTYGMPARMKEIMNISLRHQIPVVEDAAEALGSRIGNQYVGTFGKIGILSFNNNKVLTTYGGGAILTDDVELSKKVMFWAGQSRESKLYYEHKELGYNYRMGPMNAAVGLSKIDQLEHEVEQRRNSFDMYNELLDKYGFQFQMENPGFFSNRWLSAAYIKSNLDEYDIRRT